MPSGLSATISISASGRSNSLMPSRASASSSATTTRIFWSGIGRLSYAVRDSDGHRHSAAIPVGVLEGLILSVQLLESRTGVCKTDALFAFPRILFGKSVSIIHHLDVERIIFTEGSNFDQSGASPGGEPVFQCIFHDRLQHHNRHEGIQRLRSDILPYREPVFEPDLLDLEVMIEKVQLVAKRDFLRTPVVEGGPEQFAEFNDHAARHVRVLLHQHRDGIERVE